jgi:hypothetical protein
MIFYCAHSSARGVSIKSLHEAAILKSREKKWILAQFDGASRSEKLTKNSSVTISHGTTLLGQLGEKIFRLLCLQDR